MGAQIHPELRAMVSVQLHSFDICFRFFFLQETLIRCNWLLLLRLIELYFDLP